MSSPPSPSRIAETMRSSLLIRSASVRGSADGPVSLLMCYILGKRREENVEKVLSLVLSDQIGCQPHAGSQKALCILREIENHDRFKMGNGLELVCSLH